MTDNELLVALSEMMDQKIEPIKKDISGIKDRLDKIESDTSSLRVGQIKISRELKEVHELALDAWGNSVENRQLINNT